MVGFWLLVASRASLGAVVGPEAYLSAVINATPGAIIELRPGIYTEGLPILGLNGTQHQPIVIEAADPARRPQFLARPGRNTVSIVNASYVTVRNLDLDGQNLPVDAVKAEGHSDFAHHITIEGLRILRHGFDQSIVGISTKCPAWGWVIRRNEIVGAGTGMYLGDSDGTAPFFDGIIEYNLVVDSRGYDIQIKHQIGRPSDIGVPVESQTTIIRHNVLTKVADGREEHMARPNLLVGHFPKSGLGQDDHYAIYGNFLYANRAEALFQAEGNVALYANIFVNPFGDAVHIQPHNDIPKNIWIFNNSVIAAGRGIVLQGRVREYLRELRGNVVLAEGDAFLDAYPGNLVGKYEGQAKYLVDPLAPLGRMNLHLKPAVRWNGIARLGPRERFPDDDRDFEGNLFGSRDVGAYTRSVGRSEWTPGTSMEPAVMHRDTTDSVSKK